ncbi:MSCRAMM family protein [Tepidibacter thalassicus]|uniref:Carboxypeptidase regulatory-like domain-containing protein n=1 Tax=Tepidibacter thalassicus DSM 15285 TaxID=1123350 RepID=A0A1M5PDU2_9FIRM|nr:carboxypeptidase-like regulatory domain-containing protein [Tepidibacter thalassicus]SHG99956.1 Carboxypeptidase regulatory-like domain-containing protein [Tepidibacter thalassicus DSM 15285]
MAENKDIYKLGQSELGSIKDIGEEIRIDLELEDNIISDSGTVYGKVLDNEGVVLEGVTIKITDTDYNPKYHAVTDDTGQYTIEGVEAGVQYLVLAVKDGYGLKQGTPFIMQKSQQVERDFVISPDTSASSSLIAGDVVDIEGKSLEGVTVRLYNINDSQPVLERTTYTNEYGQFAFFDIPQGMYEIVASLFGYKDNRTTLVIDGPGQVRNTVINMVIDPSSRNGTINGIIKDKNGVPVENAYVILFEVREDEQGKEILTPIRTTWTNSEGLYLFEQVPQGNYKIKANKTKETL